MEVVDIKDKKVLKLLYDKNRMIIGWTEYALSWAHRVKNIDSYENIEKGTDLLRKLKEENEEILEAMAS